MDGGCTSHPRERDREWGGGVVWGLLAERWCTQHRGGMGVAGGGSPATANGETLGYGVLWPRESTDISLWITAHMCDGRIKSRSIYFVIRTRPPIKHQFHSHPPLQNICFIAIQTAKNSHPNCKRTSLREVPEPATTHTGPGQQAPTRGLMLCLHGPEARFFGSGAHKTWCRGTQTTKETAVSCLILLLRWKPLDKNSSDPKVQFLPLQDSLKVLYTSFYN